MNSTLQIGVMGARGSFSEKAAEEYIEKHFLDATVVPLVSAENVLKSLEAGEIDRGIFPIENNNGGIVIESMYAMSSYLFTIERMFEFDVHHMLLVKPGMTASHITAISSHDQALKQCKGYIARVWDGAEVIQYKDTAQAAADLASGVIPDTTAVIAPARCADLYGLEVMERSIQDQKVNFTTFVVALPRS